MPWHIEQQDNQYCVVKDSDDTVEGCHDTKAKAQDQMAALYASESKEDAMPSDVGLNIEMGIVRALWEKLTKEVSSLMEGIFKPRAWDGSASNYDSTPSYCKACLINLNQEAGNTSEDDWVQGLCKLPVKSPGSDSYNFEGIQAAAGAMSGARGGLSKPDDVSDDDWNSALKSAANTIISQYNANDETAPDGVYEAAGKEPPEERGVGFGSVYYAINNALYEMDDWPYLHDVYLDDDGSMSAIVSSRGKLMRMPFTLDEEGKAVVGEPIEIDVMAARTRTQVIRQADGRYRWFSISCTSVLNRVGEIDSTTLFDSFIDYAKQTGQYPERRFYHLGTAFRTGQADWLARDGNAYLSSGLFDEDNDLARAEIEAREKDPDYYGESIGYNPTSAPELLETDGAKIPVYRSGINTEISTVPEHKAAAWFTVTHQEVTRMSNLTDEAKQELERLFGGDTARMDAYLSTVDETNRSIADEGMVTRSESETDDEPGGEEPPEETPETSQIVEVDDEVLDSISDRAVQALTPVMDTITGTVEAIGRQLEELAQAVSDIDKRLSQTNVRTDERLKELERDEEDKLSDLVNDMPPRSKLRITHRPRTAEPEGELASPGERAAAIDWSGH